MDRSNGYNWNFIWFLWLRISKGMVEIMPFYDYECPKDGIIIAIYKTFSDETVPNCETCGTETVKKFEATPAIFRGGGWGGQ